MDEVDQMPQIVFLCNLGLKGRHAGTRSVADAAENFTVGGAVAIGFGIRQIRSVGDDVDLRFPVVAMAADAVSQESIAALGDRFLGESNGIFELFGGFGAEFPVLSGERTCGG